MPGQTQIPLYSEIFVKCREIFLLSRGADSQKSGKAIGEIAFGNAGKNSIANSSAAPTDFICCRRANLLWEPVEYFPWDNSCGMFILSNPRALPQDLSQEECSYPPENLIFGEIDLRIVW